MLYGILSFIHVFLILSVHFFKLHDGFSYFSWHMMKIMPTIESDSCQPSMSDNRLGSLNPKTLNETGLVWVSCFSVSNLLWPITKRRKHPAGTLSSCEEFDFYRRDVWDGQTLQICLLHSAIAHDPQGRKLKEVSSNFFLNFMYKSFFFRSK